MSATVTEAEPPATACSSAVTASSGGIGGTPPRRSRSVTASLPAAMPLSAHRCSASASRNAFAAA